MSFVISFILSTSVSRLVEGLTSINLLWFAYIFSANFRYWSFTSRGYFLLILDHSKKKKEINKTAVKGFFITKGLNIIVQYNYCLSINKIQSNGQGQ